MLDKVPYWRPPAVARIGDFPADLYERVREDTLFWGEGYYNPDYEYGSREENYQRGIPFPWPMTAEDVAELLDMAQHIVLLESRLPPTERADVIPASLQRTLTSELGLIEEEISDRERNLIERNLRHLRRDFVHLMLGVHGYGEQYIWLDKFGVRFFEKSPGPRTKIRMEFFYA